MALTENDNCLAGMTCPACESGGPFYLETVGPSRAVDADHHSEAGGQLSEEVYVALWSDEGSEDTVGDTDFVEDGYGKCVACRFEGEVQSFRIIE